MQILLTNDDGIDAPGLAALETAVRPLGRPVVVAPDVPLSECSHRVSTKRPIPVAEVGPGRFAAGGTPADCVRLALVHLAPETDWVAAGINAGGNLGVDVYLSGTVAAVREAALSGKPAVAFSHYRRAGAQIDWSAAAAMAGRVLEVLLQCPPSPGAFWNVNFPHLDDPAAAEPEIVFCPLDHCQLPVDYEIDPSGYRYRGVYRQRRYRPGTDVDLCFSGRIAVAEVLPCGSGTDLGPTPARR
jgi:5'-nucleotidase